MASKLGVYWSVAHRRGEDYDFFEGLNPTTFKIMDGGTPDYDWVRSHLPGALVLARDWALSEQHSDMLQDPVGTGSRHAHEWDNHQRRLGFDKKNTLILGINEPKVWEPGVSEALRLYTITMCKTAASLGMRVGTMQFSVGWPGNTGVGQPPDWSPWGGVEDAIRAGNHVLVCHEYWADGGPGEMWGWWGGRVLRCPWRVPIIVGECGIEMLVKYAGGGNRGWNGVVSGSRYAAELNEYVQRMQQDSRFLGCNVFAVDFQDRHWQSFDIQPCYGDILSNLPPEVTVPPDPPDPPDPLPEPDYPVGIIDPLVAQSILIVESRGEAFGPEGKPLIRFEAHIFQRELRNDALFNQHFRYGSPPWTNQEWRMNEHASWVPIHVNQTSENGALALAQTLDYDGSFRSISMGLGQIMGFNHVRIGYPTAEQMYKAFSDRETGEAIQTIAFMNFFLSDPQLLRAVYQKDWETIARLYNGPGNVAVYAPLLEKTYNKLLEKS